MASKTTGSNELRDAPLHAWVARAAHRRPDARAVVGADGRSLSYADLEERSNRLAAALRSMGCRRKGSVAVLMPRCPDRVVAAIAVMKAGCAYVPLDPAADVTRTAEILRSTGPAAIVAGGCSGELLDLLYARRAPGWARIAWIGEAAAPLSVELTRSDVETFPVEGAPVDVGVSDLACILFSPGGVGSMRRIPITHGDVRPLVEWMVDDFELGPEDRVLGDVPPTVGLSVVDMLAASAVGAEFHQAPERPSLPAHLYPGFLGARGVSVWLTTPWRVSTVARGRELGHADLPRLRHVAWCGDLLPATCLRRWKERWPATVFTNLYGAAEAAVVCSHFRVADQGRIGDRSDLSVGRPCPGGEFQILDDDLGAVAVGEVGEVYVRRCGANGRGAVFRTGDLGRREEDGTLHLLGRTDLPMEACGRSVHPVEIEGAVLEFEEIAACAVVPYEGGGRRGTRVACAYVPRDGRPLRTDELEERLARTLPRQLVPALWLVLDELPVGPLGQVDRDLLVRMLGGAAPEPVRGP